MKQTKSALESYTATQVTRITKVPYETLNYWAKIGLVKPSVAPATGSGSRRVYNFEDLVAVRVAQKLRRAGVFGKALVRIVEILRRTGFDSPAAVSITIEPSGDAVVTERTGQSFSALHHPRQLLLNFTCDCRAEAAELLKLAGPGEPGPRKPANAEQSVARSRSTQATRRTERRVG